MKRKFSVIILVLVFALVALVPIMVFQGCGSDPYSAAPSNSAPLVSAGTGTTVSNGTPVNLAGTASDPDGDTLTYLWTVTEPATTPGTVFSDPAILSPVFTPDAVDTAYILTLTASDGKTASSNSVLVIVGIPPDPAPYNASIVIQSGVTKVYTTSVKLRLHAEDNTGVVAYFVSEDGTPPSAGQAGWVTVTPATPYDATVNFSLSGGFGVKTVYVWFKDANDGISIGVSDDVEYVDSGGPTG